MKRGLDRSVSERQLGLLWGTVAMLLLLVAPMAQPLSALLPSCPIKSISGLPCLACGTTRAALALARLDIGGALAVNPLAAVGWMGLVAGGLVAALLAILGRPLREPAWQSSTRLRWALVSVVLANWFYLVHAGV